MTYPFVKQTGIKDCGPACLLMIIKYYHGNISLEKLKIMCNTTKIGTTAYDLMHAANNLGFKTEAYKLNIDYLFSEAITLPCIAHTVLDNKYLHYVVIYKIDKNEITIADPSKKIIKMTKSEFNTIFNSIIITFKPIKKIEYKKDYYNLKKLTLNLIKDNKNKLVILWVLSIILTIVSIIIISFTEIFLNNTKSIYIQIQTLLLYIIFSLIKYYLVKYQNNLSISLSGQIDYQLTTNVYENLFYLPYQYYCSHETGEIIKKINDISKAKNLIIFVITSVLIFLPLSILSMIVLGHINKILLLICLINIIVNIIYIKVHKQTDVNTFDEVHIKNENINSYLYTTISNISSIKGISIEDKIISKFNKKYLSYVNKLSNTIIIHLKKREKMNLINNITNGIILFIGCILIRQDQLNLISFFVFLFIKDFLFIPITNLQENNVDIKDSITTIKRLVDLNSIQTLKSDKYQILKGNIYIKKIYHQYKNKKININCHLYINRGEKIFLTGPSGTGKTTLLNQIYKNISSNNNIFIDNIDISNINNSTIKENIIYLNSSNFILPDTIDNNLFINDTKLRNKIKEICQIKENNILNLNATNLSDGEKQKLSLGRALAYNKQIFLIDEALSRIDVNTERKILKEMFSYYKDKTFIIISHRRDNIDLFDKVVEIKNNNIEILKRR